MIRLRSPSFGAASPEVQGEFGVLSEPAIALLFAHA
jgi:hypothetical protein